MLKKHSQIFQTIMFLVDMALISISWFSAYFLRFFMGPIPVVKGIPGISEFSFLLIFLLPLFATVFRSFGLYEPMRSSGRLDEIKKILSASMLSTIVFITLLYLVKEYKYSRVFFIYFIIVNTSLIIIFRYILRLILGNLRKHGLNQRYILILGDGDTAKELERKLVDHAEYGFKVAGFLSKDKEMVGKKINGVPVLGTYKDVKNVLRQTQADQLVLALPFEHIRMLRPILGEVYDEMVELKIVLDFYQYFTLRKSIEILDGLPILSLRESPLYGWNRILKRLLDIFISMILLCLFFPLMVLIAFLIKVTSVGPIFYKQRRMGIDGRKFNIIKFRSMKINAESDTGPVWAKKDDERRTDIGKLLRSTNLDELPQLLNVFSGEMSMVGPRPERPEFMDEFKKRIPEYMLRHKMKAGITGWAQVNGLRGNTSLEERTKYDLYYIENWSIGFDLKILFKTFLAIKNAY